MKETLHTDAISWLRSSPIPVIAVGNVSSGFDKRWPMYQEGDHARRKEYQSAMGSLVPALVSARLTRRRHSALSGLPLAPDGVRR
jgi:hypothetical protein